MEFFKNTHSCKVAQWVGKFYPYHDIVLFIFWIIISVGFLISLIFDWLRNKPIGHTIYRKIYKIIFFS